MKRVLPVLFVVAIALGIAWWMRGRSPQGSQSDGRDGADAGGAAQPAIEEQAATPAAALAAAPDAAAAQPTEPAAELEPLDCNAPTGDVATIDGEGLSAAELCAAWRTLSGPLEAGDPSVMDKQGKALLDRMIDARLIKRALSAAGKPITPAEIEAAFDALWKKQGGSRRAFEQTLRDQGVDAETVRRDLEQRLARERLVELRGDLEPTGEEISAAYAADPTRFGKPKSAILEGFLARAAPSAPAQARAKALSAAQAFAAGVAAGGDAKRLAQEHGLDATPPVELTREAGEPELVEIAFALSPGQWTQPVQTRAGWVVGKLVKIDEGKSRPFEEVRDRVRDLVKSERRLREQQRVVADLRAQAKIVQLQW